MSYFKGDEKGNRSSVAKLSTTPGDWERFQEQFKILATLEYGICGEALASEKHMQFNRSSLQRSSDISDEESEESEEEQQGRRKRKRSKTQGRKAKANRDQGLEKEMILINLKRKTKYEDDSAKMTAAILAHISEASLQRLKRE
jgi:hypothetical protein